MKRKRILKICLLTIIMIGVAFYIFCYISIGASTDEYVQLAKLSYDYVVSHIYTGNGGYGGPSVTGTFSNYAYNIPCMHLTQNGTTLSSGTTGCQELLGYVMISSDGTAVSYTYNASTGVSTESTTITNKKTEFQNTARMCYYVTTADGGVDYYESSSYFTGGKVGSGDTSGTWLQLIGWYNQYASSFGWSTSWFEMESRSEITLSTSSGPWALAVANPENITCEAIILYYASHGQQASIMCIGKLGESAPEIDKYIYKTENKTHATVGDRSGMSNGSNGDKYASPVKVAPGEEVTYQIVIENNSSSSIEVDLTDTFASCFSYVSSTASFTWNNSGNTISASNVTVPADGLEFKVTLKVSETATIGSTPRRNRITIEYDGDEQTADDYIVVDPRNYREKIYNVCWFTNI